MLAHPSRNGPLRLVTDASDTGMGASVEQFQNNSWKPLGFISRSFSAAQRNYSTYDRELTAVFESIKYFRYTLEGREFKVVTDHKPLTYAFSQKLNSVHLVFDNNLIKLARAQEVDEELKSVLQNENFSLKLKNIQCGPDQTTIVCDITGDILRPFVPQSLQKQIFDTIHDPAHPSAKISDRIIRKNYVWPKMNIDIKNWCRSCVACQRSKVTRHTIINPSHFVMPESRFNHVHIDIVGSLPYSDGYAYILTMIDRFSRWPEAIPLKNIEAITICRAFVDGWISRFGTLETVTTDQGRQFESRIFSALLRMNGCERIRTTPYHPESNGIIERWHRTLKSALMCHSDKNWVRSLSTVLMGLKNNVLDSGASPAEFLYGKSLRVPGEFILPEDPSSDHNFFLEEFRENMRVIKPAPVTHKHSRKVFLYKNLYSCSHVFLRVRKTLKKSIEHPYTGPHKVLNRVSEKVDEIDVNEEKRRV